MAQPWFLRPSHDLEQLPEHSHLHTGPASPKTVGSPDAKYSATTMGPGWPRTAADTALSWPASGIISAADMGLPDGALDLERLSSTAFDRKPSATLV